MLDGCLPSGVDSGVVNGAHLVIVPSFQGVDDSTRMTGMDTIPLHGHFTRLEILGVPRHAKGGQLGVGAILS